MTNESFESNELSHDESGAIEQAGQLPLGVGGFGEADGAVPFEDDTPNSRINSGALIIGIVILTATASVIGMRAVSKSTGAAAAASNTQVESQIESFLETLTTSEQNHQDTQANEASILKVLSTEYSERQIPLEDVKKNPFITNPEDATPEPTEDPGISSQTAWKRQRSEMLTQYQEASERIVVSSVMGGSNPLANINGKLFRIGDSLSMEPNAMQFTVTAIRGGIVTLLVEVKEFDIKSTYTISLK